MWLITAGQGQFVFTARLLALSTRYEGIRSACPWKLSHVYVGANSLIIILTSLLHNLFFPSLLLVSQTLTKENHEMQRLWFLRSPLHFYFKNGHGRKTNTNNLCVLRLVKQTQDASQEVNILLLSSAAYFIGVANKVCCTKSCTKCRTKSGVVMCDDHFKQKDYLLNICAHIIWTLLLLLKTSVSLYISLVER